MKDQNKVGKLSEIVVPGHLLGLNPDDATSEQIAELDKLGVTIVISMGQRYYWNYEGDEQPTWFRLETT